MQPFTVHDLRDKPALRDVIAWHLWHQWGKPSGQKYADRQWMIGANSSTYDRWHHAFVATEDNLTGPEAFLGTASLAKHDIKTRQDLTPWLASVYTSPAARHRGVGRALVEQVERLAANKGVQTLWLYTPDKMHFYAHMGWQEVEPYKDEHGQTHIIMNKQL